MPSTPTLRPVLKRRLLRGRAALIGLFLCAFGGVLIGSLTLGLTQANVLGYELGDLPEKLALPAGLLTTAFLLWSAFADAIEVGVDGVRVFQFGRRRFFHYRDIVGGRLLMGKERWLLQIDLRGGRSPQIRVGTIEVSDAREIMSRILEERAAFAASTLGDDVNDALEPNGRSMNVWRAEVTQLLGVGDYRRIRISAADALDTLESAAAPPARRLGAAMALTGAGGAPDAVSRIRSVAGATADPLLRAALESIAEGDADAEALEAAVATRPRAS